MDVVAHSDELLVAVANGNDQCCDTLIKNCILISSSLGILEMSGGGQSTVNFMVDSSVMGPI